MDINKVLPMHRNLICDAPSDENRTASGLYIPRNEVVWIELTVKIASPDAERVKAGDKILIHVANLTRFECLGDKYVLCSEVDVVLHEVNS